MPSLLIGNRMDNTRNIISGIGSALVDILAHESEMFVKETGAARGGMTLVDSSVIKNTLARLSGKPQIVPGGSACNAVRGVAMLGGTARFVGKKGDDDFGRLFTESLTNINVIPHLFYSGLPTGRVLSLVTPDSERTMLTYLGAASEIGPLEVTPECFKNSSIVLIEGYLLFNEALMMSALESARANGSKVALDLASYNVVEEKKTFLLDHVPEYVDILIANEDEAAVFAGKKDEMDCLMMMKDMAEIAVVKIGKRGSLIYQDGKTHKIPPMGSGSAVDTTGAGDLWAGGFLYGLSMGYDMDMCGKIASAAGYEVCQVMGTIIPDEGWERIRSVLPK